ncbi:MAG: hypothetical protein WC787_02590 [Patescibacteria group bacterium]|jgi:hypothetical protein
MTLLSRAFVAAGLSLALVGAGCSAPTLPGQTPSGPKLSTFENVSPKDAALRINFVPGSVIETRSTFLGFGAKLAAAMAGQNKEGTRVIVITRFAPNETANVEWKLSSKVEGATSIKAREQARKEKKTEPEPVMVDQTALGQVNGINLKDAHSMMLPAYWPETTTGTAFGTSGIWLSKDVFEGYSRSRVATLDFGILDPSIQGAVAKASEFRDALTKLQGQVTKIEERTDVFLLKGEEQPSEWTLKVNGQDVKVEVLKGRTWFGEIVVLNNPQNPLVLKVTLNPATSGVTDLITNFSALKALFGYEVTELKDVQP